MRQSFLASLRLAFKRSDPKLSPPRPERPLAIVGDIHGCYELMLALLDQLPPAAQVVFLGDYIDRGPQSAEVLDALQTRSDFICLQGNHEDMLLRFLENPENHGPLWLKHGGLQTLTSFGVCTPSRYSIRPTFEEIRDDLLMQMGPELLAWLRDRPTSYHSGTVFAAHAGANPRQTLMQQERKDLLWGHSHFYSRSRRDGNWVVHGHIIQPRAHATRGRIAVDTGAYDTGILSAVYLTPQQEGLFVCVDRSGKTYRRDITF